MSSGYDPALINPIKTAQLDQPAPRPLRSGLVTLKAETELGYQPLHHRTGARRRSKASCPGRAQLGESDSRPVQLQGIHANDQVSDAMLDINDSSVKHPDSSAPGVRRKGEDPARVDEAIALDEQRRQLLQHAESLKSRKNTVSAQVATMKAKGEDAAALITEMRAVADEIKGLDEQLQTVEESSARCILQIPNIPHAVRSRRANTRPTTSPSPNGANRP